MRDLRDQVRVNQNFFLNELLDVLCGEATDTLREAAGNSYEAYAALNLLFCPDISQNAGAGKEPIFVTKIKQALTTLGT